MLILIGSRAAKFHFSNFRNPKDWDFITTRDEIEKFSSLNLVSKHSDKFTFKSDCGFVEIEFADQNSSELISQFVDGEIETPFGKASIASPDALFLLKQSHVCFSHMWNKTFRDYKFFQNWLGCIPNSMKSILEMRIEETKKRLKFKDKNFSVSNEKFFNDRVSRIVEHDSIHESIKFTDVPIFKLLKDDLNSAEISYQKFLELPFDLKIKNYQEECMALTIERFAIPSRINKTEFDEKRCSGQILRSMCFNYLPFDFRMFCIDHFYEILDSIPEGFSSKVVDELGI